MSGIIVNMYDVRIVEFVGVFHDEDSNSLLQFWSPFFFFFPFCFLFLRVIWCNETASRACEFVM